MILLAWDTSTLNLSVAVFDKNRCIHNRAEFRETHQQSKLLFSALKSILQDVKISPAEVDAVAVGLGPGSYTGLRVGVTVAKTWAFAKGISCYSFSSALALERSDDPERLSLQNLRFPEDFNKVEDLNELVPIYHNDHFR